MAVANTGTDVLFHDTFYVVGHFHVMFAGSAMLANFGAFYFYFPSGSCSLHAVFRIFSFLFSLLLFFCLLRILLLLSDASLV